MSVPLTVASISQKYFCFMQASCYPYILMIKIFINIRVIRITYMINIYQYLRSLTYYIAYYMIFIILFQTMKRISIVILNKHRNIFRNRHRTDQNLGIIRSIIDMLILLLIKEECLFLSLLSMILNTSYPAEMAYLLNICASPVCTVPT